MKEPTNAIASFFYDGKAQAYSMARMVMFGGFLISVLIGLLTLYITFDSYKHGKAIPDLSWFLYGGGASGVTGVGAYAMNRWGSKTDPEPEEKPDLDLPDAPEEEQ